MPTWMARGLRVLRILVEGGRAVGVDVTQDGRTVVERAHHVVADIGLANTLSCLDRDIAPS